MNIYPKWLLLLAGSNLASLLLIPLFAFGSFAPFGTGSTAFVGFLLYVLTNSLSLYANYHERLGVAVAVAGLALTIVDYYLLYIHL